jgi:hypothetical protein
MMHGFDVEIATNYGLEEAVIIHNFQFWLNKNYSDGINRHDGRTWTYNTTASLAKLFPYMTARAVRYAIDNLVKKGVLIKGNYNKLGYDRTVWYAFYDEKMWLYSVRTDLTKTANGNDENVKSHLTKTANGNDENVEPIPDSKQQIVNHTLNTDITCAYEKQKTKNNKSESAEWFEKFYSAYPRKVAKDAAKKAWNKISPNLYSVIVDDVINRTANHVGWKSKEFIVYPATYLNGKRWTDEILLEQVNNGKVGGSYAGNTKTNINTGRKLSLVEQADRDIAIAEAREQQQYCGEYAVN